MKFTFDEWTIGPMLYEYIVQYLPPKAVILELGSGRGSELLSQSYEVYSVEDNPAYWDKYPVHYIKVRSVDGWYDPVELQRQIPDHYNCLLIDGPAGSGNRLGILKHILIFNLMKPIIFCDDVNRENELKVFNALVNLTQRMGFIVKDQYSNITYWKDFGVII